MNWAYLAGFTDGDGCITVEIAKGKYRYSRLRWSQKQSNSLVLYAIGDFLSLHGIKISKRNFSVAVKGHKYPQVELAITNCLDTAIVLRELLPFLINKRERAEQALMWAERKLKKHDVKLALVNSG